MVSAKILILGGYGGTGRVLSRLLLRETDAEVVVAGRRLERAEELAAQLNREFPGDPATARHADASDSRGLRAAFEGISLVVVASTTTQHVGTVAEAAIAAGTDYLDYHFQREVLFALKAMAPRIEEAQRCFITQAGFHPGLPSVFVRYPAGSFDRYRKAVVAIGMNARVERSESLYELVDSLGDFASEVYRQGQWIQATSKDARRIDLGSLFGVRTCFPMQLEEMRPLPALLGLEEAGVYVAGFNWFVDYIVFPLGMVLFRVKKGLGRGLVGDLMAWGVNTLSPPTQGVSFILDAEGEKEGRSLKVRIAAEHGDAYEFTAIPVVACIRQYLDGSICRPGVWMMGHVVDPVRLLDDMRRMGVRIRIQTRSSPELGGAARS